MGHGERHGRRSIRLKGYDYARDGAYFVTICTRGRERAFGAVVRGEMHLNKSGREVARCWTWLAERYPYVYLDEYIVMPDHTHAIIVITDAHDEGGHKNLPLHTSRMPTNHVGAVREPPNYAPPLPRTP